MSLFSVYNLDAIFAAFWLIACHPEGFVVFSQERPQYGVQGALRGAGLRLSGLCGAGLRLSGLRLSGLCGAGLRGTGAAGLVGVVLLAAGGCGGSSSTTPPAAGSTAAPVSSPATSAASGTSAAASASDPTALSGSTLKTLLLPASMLPAGFKPDATGARNTGDAVGQDSASPVAASKFCGLLTGTSWILAAGVDSATFAQNDYLDAGRTQEIAQEIDTFSAADATKVMAGLWQAFGRCRDFTQKYNGANAKTTLVRSRPTSAAYAAIEAVQTSPTFSGGTTLVAIRSGNAIITVLYSASSHDKGGAAVTLAEGIAQRVQHVQGQL